MTDAEAASAVSARVEALVEAPLQEMGVQLVDVEYRFEGRWVLRLLVDRPEGVSIDDCARVSEAVGELLDARDPVPTGYSLEVSSPGLFRPLRGPRHYRQAVGKIARFNLAAGHLPELRGRRVRGTVTAVGETALTVDTPEGSVELPFEAIRNAKLDPDL